MKLGVFKNPAFKKGLGIVSVAIAGVAAISEALSNQKKEQEFEAMKKAISELQGKRES